MTVTNSRSPKETVQFTERGIPILNLWHMLLYAWNEVPLKDRWMLEDAERAPALDALLASVLMKLMQRRLRIGLGRHYVDEEATLRGIRGRIVFGESLKRRAFEKGEAYNEFQGYSTNEPRNQIIRTTLLRLAQAGQFEPATDSAKRLRRSLRRLARDMEGIDLIELHADVIHRALSFRNDRDYRLMLAICDLILQRQMPMESAGGFDFLAIDRDALVLHSVYERFVANFYRIHLTGWDVTTQKRLEWHAKETNEHLPVMVPDLVLQEISSGRLIILDTKFTPHSMIENRWDKPVFDSSHLYQLYAYLRSQEHLSEGHRRATGFLLYPAIKYRFSERIELQDHAIRIECIDLAMPWQEIEGNLLELVEEVSQGS